MTETTELNFNPLLPAEAIAEYDAGKKTGTVTASAGGEGIPLFVAEPNPTPLPG